MFDKKKSDSGPVLSSAASANGARVRKTAVAFGPL